MKFCMVLSFFLFLFPLSNVAQTGTLPDPFTALGQAWHVPASGTYHFNIGGTTFSTYVESGAGWILVASGSSATNESSYATTSNLVLQSDQILPAAVYTSALVAAVRMNATAGPELPFDVQSTDAVVLSNLQNNRTLSTNSNSTAWSGTGTAFLSRFCNPAVSSLSTHIYHACGNGGGMHWQVGQNQDHEKINLSASKNDLNLWIRADQVALLPVVLTSFSANLLSNHTVEINWQTASEANSESFVVERSRDANNWEELKTVAAAGFTTSPQKYRAYDERPYADLTYYRLKQVEIDGKFFHSKIIPVVVATGSVLNIYPNPVVNGKLVIALPERSAIRIYNNTGQLLLTRQLPAGQQKLDVSNFAKGLYILQVNSRKATILLR